MDKTTLSKFKIKTISTPEQTATDDEIKDAFDNIVDDSNDSLTSTTLSVYKDSEYYYVYGTELNSLEFSIDDISSTDEVNDNMYFGYTSLRSCLRECDMANVDKSEKVTPESSKVKSIHSTTTNIFNWQKDLQGDSDKKILFNEYKANTGFYSYVNSLEKKIIRYESSTFTTDGYWTRQLENLTTTEYSTSTKNPAIYESFSSENSPEYFDDRKLTKNIYLKEMSFSGEESCSDIRSQAQILINDVEYNQIKTYVLCRVNVSLNTLSENLTKLLVYLLNHCNEWQVYEPLTNKVITVKNLTGKEPYTFVPDEWELTKTKLPTEYIFQNLECGNSLFKENVGLKGVYLTFPKIKDITDMFEECTSLTSIYVHFGENTCKIPSNIFESNEKLKTLNMVYDAPNPESEPIPDFLYNTTITQANVVAENSCIFSSNNYEFDESTNFRGTSDIISDLGKIDISKENTFIFHSKYLTKYELTYTKDSKTVTLDDSTNEEQKTSTLQGDGFTDDEITDMLEDAKESAISKITDAAIVNKWRTAKYYVLERGCDEVLSLLNPNEDMTSIELKAIRVIPDNGYLLPLYKNLTNISINEINDNDHKSPLILYKNQSLMDISVNIEKTESVTTLDDDGEEVVKNVTTNGTLKISNDTFNDCKDTIQSITFNCIVNGSSYSPFQGLTTLQDCLINKYINEGNSAKGFFQGCSLLKNLNGISFTSSFPPSDSSYMFYGCTSLESATFTHYTDAGDNTKISNAENMYYDCASLEEDNNTYGTVLSNAKGMYYGCTAITKVPDLFAASFSKLNDYTNTFNGCESLISVAGDTTINGKSINCLDYTFSGCSSLLSFKIGNITNLNSAQGAFSGCGSLTKENLSQFQFNKNASSKNASEMFKDCTSLESVPIVTNISTGDNMFENCTSIEKTRASGGVLTNFNSTVTSANSMFKGCTSLTYDNLTSTTQTGYSALTEANCMYSGCYSLLTTPVAPAVKRANRMFEDCSSLTSIALGSSCGIEEADEMFSGCKLTVAQGRLVMINHLKNFKTSIPFVKVYKEGSSEEVKDFTTNNLGSRLALRWNTVKERPASIVNYLSVPENIFDSSKSSSNYVTYKVTEEKCSEEIPSDTPTVQDDDFIYWNISGEKWIQIISKDLLLVVEEITTEPSGPELEVLSNDIILYGYTYEFKLYERLGTSDIENKSIDLYSFSDYEEYIEYDSTKKFMKLSFQQYVEEEVCTTVEGETVIEITTKMEEIVPQSSAIHHITIGLNVSTESEAEKLWANYLYTKATYDSENQSFLSANGWKVFVEYNYEEEETSSDEGTETN